MPASRPKRSILRRRLRAGGSRTCSRVWSPTHLSCATGRARRPWMVGLPWPHSPPTHGPDEAVTPVRGATTAEPSATTRLRLSQDAVHYQMLAGYYAADELARRRMRVSTHRGVWPPRRLPFDELDIAVFNPHPITHATSSVHRDATHRLPARTARPIPRSSGLNCPGYSRSTVTARLGRTTKDNAACSSRRSATGRRVRREDVPAFGDSAPPSSRV